MYSLCLYKKMITKEVQCFDIGTYLSYVGKHLTLRGEWFGQDIPGGGFFWLFVGEGIDFLTSKGGYPLDSFTRISKIFQNFQARGGTLWIFGSNFSKRGGICILPKSPLPEGEEPWSKIFLGGISFRLLYACPCMLSSVKCTLYTQFCKYFPREKWRHEKFLFLEIISKPYMEKSMFHSE